MKVKNVVASSCWRYLQLMVGKNWGPWSCSYKEFNCLSYVSLYGYEYKKAECWRTGAFKLWWWRRLLTVPWTTRKSNQSILKGIDPEYSLEVLMLKLKLQYFGHLMWQTDSFEKTLMLGKIEGKRRRGQQRMRSLDSITDSSDVSLSKLQEIVEGSGAWHTAIHGVVKSWTQFSNWTNWSFSKDPKVQIRTQPGQCFELSFVILLTEAEMQFPDY